MSLSQNLITTNTCKSQSYIDLVLQRKRAQLYNVPPPRYDNLAKNPYTQINPVTSSFFTNFDLSMRRKAEILKYSNNTSSTKTNNLTRAQRWAQLVNGKSQQYSQAYVNNNPPVCPDTIVYTSSTASGVPGPPILLYEDDKVPLYNLINTATQNANYGTQESIPTNIIWNTYPLSNAVSLQQDAAFIVSQNSIFNTLVIEKNVETRYVIYSMTVPLVIYVEADASTNLVGHYKDPTSIQISVSQVELAVFYSQSAIPLNSDISYSLSNVAYNSPENAMNISADVSVNMYSSDPAYNRFNAYGYAGEINITNIKIPTQPSYIYDMELRIGFNVSTSSNFSTFFGSIPSVYFAYLNPTIDITQKPPLNCKITNPYTATPVSFSISGTAIV